MVSLSKNVGHAVKEQDAGRFRAHTVRNTFPGVLWPVSIEEKLHVHFCSSKQAALWRFGPLALCLLYKHMGMENAGSGGCIVSGLCKHRPANPLHAWLEKHHHHMPWPVQRKQLILITQLFLQVQKIPE